MRWMRTIPLTLFFIISTTCCFSQVAITPLPISVMERKGIFTLTKATLLYYSYQSKHAAHFLNHELASRYQLPLPEKIYQGKKTAYPQKNYISLYVDPDEKNESAYTLAIDSQKISVSGSASGVFYAVQSLLQLLPTTTGTNPSMSIPCMEVVDSARFHYRGMHLDVGRHLFSVAYIKKYIDYLAYHKMNMFHWHLTEDQGWRIEIKKYPKLSLIGGFRKQTLLGAFGSDQYDGNKYGGFYTQDEIKEVVAYASARFITIIPEIDLPGHCLAALAAYPYLGCSKGPYEVMQTWGVSEDVLCVGNDSSYQFVADVLKEVLELFPSQYIHLGGDECPKTRWKICKDCQQKMKLLDLKNEEALQKHFIQWVATYLKNHGRKMIGWDDILESGITSDVTVMSWRGDAGGLKAAQNKMEVILSPDNPFYLNHAQSRNEDSITQGGYNSIEAVYQYDPLPAELPLSAKQFVLGAQGNLWTEYISNEKKLEYQLFPRLSAIAEVVWTAKKNRNLTSFKNRLPQLFKRYEFWGANYSKAYYELQETIERHSHPAGLSWKLFSTEKNGHIIWKKDEGPVQLLPADSLIPIYSSGNYQAAWTDQEGNPANHWIKQSFQLHLGTGKSIHLVKEPHPSYSQGGSLTLLDGIQNTAGMSKSTQFLGFWGNDFTAVVDLGKEIAITEVIISTFAQPESWIYAPEQLYVKTGIDSVNLVQQDAPVFLSGSRHVQLSMKLPLKTRYLHIHIPNQKLIVAGQPGAGNPSWLFIDEIIIK